MRANALQNWLCWQMPYHTAHHIFPAVPFWKLRDLNARIETSAGEVHRMGWIEFQIEVIGKLMAKDESAYPMDEVWVMPEDICWQAPPDCMTFLFYRYVALSDGCLGQD